MVKKVSKSKIVTPGTFFKLEEYFREDNIRIVMVMAPEHLARRKEKDEMGYICAAVRPSAVVDGAYELFVADQRVIKSPALGEEVVLKYDTKTRYYYITD